MPIATVSAKGAVVIPAEFREKHGIRPGTKVSFIEVNGRIQIIPLSEDPIKALRGSLRIDKSVHEILREGREKDRRHEEFLGKMFSREKKQ